MNIQLFSNLSNNEWYEMIILRYVFKWAIFMFLPSIVLALELLHRRVYFLANSCWRHL